MKKLVIVAMIILLAGMLLVSVSSAETQVTVTPANMNGWTFSFDDTNTTGIGSFAVGPATPPLGNGSARLAVLDDFGNARPFLAHAYPETRLDAITQLKYSTYVDPVSGASVDITLALNVDYDITDADTSWQGRLTYEPYMSGTVLKGQWQTWDTLAGEWWASKAPGNTFCPQSTPCTWSEVLQHFPNAGIHSTMGAIILKAGGGSIGWAHFNGYTDNLVVGIDNVDTVYDFEPPSTVYVNANWASTPQWTDPDADGPANAMGLDAFATIQEGVDAVAPGGTVEVAPGTYDEQVIVNKGLTLEGAGDTTVIQPSQTTANGFTVFNRLSSGSNNSAAILVTDTTDSVTVRNLKLDGSKVTNTPGADFMGILYRGTPGVIDSITVDGISVSNGNAIYLSGFGSPVNVSVTSSTVSGYFKNGITANNPGMTATISDNTITGVGPTSSVAQNGIQIGFGATGMVSGNTISDNAWTSTYGGTNDPATDADADGASGVLLYMPASGVEISGNTLTGNQFGVWTVAAPDVDIHDNTITGLAHTGSAFPTGIAIWSSDMWTVDLGGSEQSTSASLVANKISTTDYGVLVRDFDDASAAKPSLTASGNQFTGNAIQVSASTEGLFDVAATLSGNTLDRAVTVDHAGSSLLPTIWSRIQDGINAASDGDTVNVAGGTYDENVVINKATTLQGAGKDVTFIDGVNTGTSDTTVNITAGGDVTVEGFTVTNAATTNTTDKRFGVLTNSPMADVTYTITNNKVIGTNNPDNQEDYGIYGQNGGKENLVITHNVVTQTGANNIVVEAHQGTTGISYNTLDAGAYGTDAIFIMTHSAKDVSNKQTVSDNDIDMSTGIGTSGATGISFATVAGTYGTTPARFLAGSIEISNNTIHDLKANRRGIGFWNDAAAGQGADGDIISPLVINNSVEAVTGNPAGSMGIDTIGQVSNAEITNNAISNVDFCYKERVWNENIASGTLLNQNSFVNCADGVTTERTTGTLDATQNWWDSQFGPTNAFNPDGDGQVVSDNVNFDPWLCSGVDSDPSAVGFQPASVDGCTAAAPTQLVFSTQPGGAIFNHPLNPQPVVVAQNANGDRSVNFNQDVSVSLGGGATGAALKGDATVTAVNGVAIFSGLSIDKPGKGYTLTALSLNPQLEMLSNPFDVSALVLYLPSIYR
jgi:nitrous oxidase accessory protein NosD